MKQELGWGGLGSSKHGVGADFVSKMNQIRDYITAQSIDVNSINHTNLANIVSNHARAIKIEDRLNQLDASKIVDIGNSYLRWNGDNAVATTSVPSATPSTGGGAVPRLSFSGV